MYQGPFFPHFQTSFSTTTPMMLNATPVEMPDNFRRRKMLDEARDFGVDQFDQMDASYVKQICEEVENTKDVELLISFLGKLNLTKHQQSDYVLKSLCVLHYHQDHFEKLYQVIQGHQFDTEYHKPLQDIWHEAHYREKSRSRELDPVTRYRVRKKHPFPPTIWDGESTSYCFRVSNWFKNQRQRARQNRRHNGGSSRNQSNDFIESEREDSGGSGNLGSCSSNPLSEEDENHQIHVGISGLNTSSTLSSPVNNHSTLSSGNINPMSAFSPQVNANAFCAFPQFQFDNCWPTPSASSFPAQPMYYPFNGCFASPYVSPYANYSTAYSTTSCFKMMNPDPTQTLPLDCPSTTSALSSSTLTFGSSTASGMNNANSYAFVNPTVNKYEEL
ncbi:Protein sine oculis isoform X2 [Aphelenchoides besseyi]|nr:Protein sine oculis isoform X2 [Aphelenchoides besseyi]